MMKGYLLIGFVKVKPLHPTSKWSGHWWKRFDGKFALRKTRRWLLCCGIFVVEFETAFEKAKAFYERLLGWIPQTRLPSKLREAYIYSESTLVLVSGEE
jgi:hypothetical protein